MSALSASKLPDGVRVDWPEAQPAARAFTRRSASLWHEDMPALACYSR